ncbi:hypothetical protein ACVI55_003889 [Sinorhizobium medicae]
MRIHEQEEGNQLLTEAEVADVLGERSGIKHVAKVDREDGKHHQPGLHIASEEFDADHLACTRIDGGTHEDRIGNRKTVIHRKCAEKRSEGRRRQHDWKAAAQPFPEIASNHGILPRGRSQRARRQIACRTDRGCRPSRQFNYSDAAIEFSDGWTCVIPEGRPPRLVA